MPDDDDYIAHGARERRQTKPGRGKPRKLATAIPARVRQKKSPLRRSIERGLNRDSAGDFVSRAIAHGITDFDSRQIAAARELLFHLERHDWLPHIAVDDAVRLAAHHRAFKRPASAFSPDASVPPADLLHELARHLFERWPIPHWLVNAWEAPTAAPQHWYIHLGDGHNLRTAPDLPFPMTRKMAHFATSAPPGLEWGQAMRWGQLLASDVPEELAHELVLTRLATPLPDEPLWAEVVKWFGRNPETFGHGAEIVDYLFAQRIGDFAAPLDPDIDIRKRTPDRMLALAREWHDTLRRPSMPCGDRRWIKSAFPDFLPMSDAAGATPTVVPIARASWCIVELVSEQDLAYEGETLNHCVHSYTSMAASGQVAIFSLRRRVEGKLMPRVTIELSPAGKQIVQARGLRNRFPDRDDQKLIEAWAQTYNLAIAPSVFNSEPIRRNVVRR